MRLSPAIDANAVARALGGEGSWRTGEPLWCHTTLRLGGPAEVWAEPASVEAVVRLRRLCHQRGWPCHVFGGGSNVLVRDGGLPGLVLSARRLDRLEIVRRDGESIWVSVGAGVATGKLLAWSLREGLGGVEFLAGIPGSIGGGVAMNAGTVLGEFRDVVERVTAVGPTGEPLDLGRADCGFVYRGSAFLGGAMIVEAELRLGRQEPDRARALVRRLRERRRGREPRGVFSAGSVFKNPTGDHAGRLIEACGLKGRRVGGAEVSSIHANWIVHRGEASAGDFLALMDEVRQAVRARFGIELEPEIKVLGDEPG